MFETSDIALASYLMMKNVKLISAGKESGGRFRFVFDDSKNECNVHSIDYVNSDFSKFKFENPPRQRDSVNFLNMNF